MVLSTLRLFTAGSMIVSVGATAQFANPIQDYTEKCASSEAVEALQIKEMVQTVEDNPTATDSPVSVVTEVENEEVVVYPGDASSNYRSIFVSEQSFRSSPVYVVKIMALSLELEPEPEDVRTLQESFTDYARNDTLVLASALSGIAGIDPRRRLGSEENPATHKTKLAKLIAVVSGNSTGRRLIVNRDPVLEEYIEKDIEKLLEIFGECKGVTANSSSLADFFKKKWDIFDILVASIVGLLLICCCFLSACYYHKQQREKKDAAQREQIRQPSDMKYASKSKKDDWSRALMSQPTRSPVKGRSNGQGSKK